MPRPAEPVVLRPAADFTAVAEEIVSALRAKLGDMVPDGVVEHIGGTSLPRGDTKGDVDVNLRVPPDRMPMAVDRLESWYEVAQRENWTATFASFSDPHHQLPVGIQVTATGGPEDHLVAVRDLLRGRPELLERYVACKQRAAFKGQQGYWEAKNALLQSIIHDYGLGGRSP